MNIQISDDGKEITLDGVLFTEYKEPEEVKVENIEDSGSFTPLNVIDSIMGEVAPNSPSGKKTKIENLRKDLDEANKELGKSMRHRDVINEELKREEKKLKEMRDVSELVKIRLGGHSRETIYGMLDTMFTRSYKSGTTVHTGGVSIEDIDGLIADEGLYEDIIEAAGGEVIYETCVPYREFEEIIKKEREEATTEEENNALDMFESKYVMSNASGKHRLRTSKKFAKKLYSRMNRPKILDQMTKYGKKVVDQNKKHTR